MTSISTNGKNWINIAKRDREPEYNLLLYSFVVAKQQGKPLPVSPDSNYHVTLHINGVEVDFREVAHYVMERYDSMLETRAAEIAKASLDEKMWEVEEKCRDLIDGLQEGRRAIRDFIREKFPKYRQSEDD